MARFRISPVFTSECAKIDKKIDANDFWLWMTHAQKSNAKKIQVANGNEAKIGDIVGSSMIQYRKDMKIPTKGPAANSNTNNAANKAAVGSGSMGKGAGKGTGKNAVNFVQAFLPHERAFQTQDHTSVKRIMKNEFDGSSENVFWTDTPNSLMSRLESYINDYTNGPVAAVVLSDLNSFLN